MFRTFITAAVLALTIVSAQAGSAKMDVRFGDLNLASPKDAQILSARVHTAAEAVCGPVAYTADGRASAVYDAISSHTNCVHQAADRALAQIQALQARRTMLSRN